MGKVIDMTVRRNKALKKVNLTLPVDLVEYAMKITQQDTELEALRKVLRAGLTVYELLSNQPTKKLQLLDTETDTTTTITL